MSALAIDRQVTSGATTIVVAETAAFREFTGRIHPDRLIPIGCLSIKDEGHQSGDHKQEHVSEISILATLFREVFKGVHCRVLGVVVNAVSLQY